ncbi:phage tail protein [Lysinibacillus sphaericus]|uniref:phage tail protein n=1 Tax=Lysinibacillus sphaericus TaxID=1421 RepID=UPI000690FF63|nr:phage tail protein [Lysinibacillus sphaericus]QTB24335.1 phage tail protein [Lysinibacillus sphaericus]
MSENFYTILTNAGLAAIANAVINQTQVNFAKLGVGDGNGAYYTPTQEATALRNQVWIGNISSVTADTTNPNWVNVETVIPGNVGGFEIRELGIFDDNNVLLAIGKLPLTYKPNFAEGSSKDLYIKAIFEVTNASAVTLKVDPSVIYASKKYVDDKVAVVVSGLENAQQQLKNHEVDYVKHPGYGVTTFNSPTYSVTLSPAPTQYVDGMGLVLRLNADQVAGNAAINVNGLGVKNILNSKGFSVTNLKKDVIYSFRYSAAKGAFILQGESEVEIGQQIIKPSTTKQTILKGSHDGTGYVEGDSNLTASNILAGKTIFGITGNVQPKQFRIFYITGNDAFEKIDWGFPYSVMVVTNSLQNYHVYLTELGDGGYFGGGNYMPGMPKFTTTTAELYLYKNGGTYTIKVYG